MIRQAVARGSGLGICLLVAFAGCADLGDDVTDDIIGPPPPTVSFAADIQPIFDLRCIGCHGAQANAGLDLRAGTSYGELVGVASTELPAMDRISPGDPANSWLYLKITGGQTFGEPMPRGAFPMPEADVDLIEQWILEGALDN